MPSLRRWSPGDLLFPEEAKDILKVSRATVYRLADSGALPSVRIGGALRITRLGLENYLDSLLLSRSTTATPQDTDPDAILRRIEQE